MILVDLSQTMISNLMVEMGREKRFIPDMSMVRHMILNSLRSYNHKFSFEYGEMILCCDSRHSWRREIFPFYKASRRKSKAKSQYDWLAIHEMMGQIIEELKENLPYRVISVEKSEADDIIAVLSKLDSDSKTLIVSGDKDFLQLHTNPNIRQWQPVQSKFVEIDNPSKFLIEHIASGDVSDGVPNCLSDDDVFVSERRQKPLRKTLIQRILLEGPEKVLTSTQMRNYHRNRMLIDLSQIPETLSTEISSQFLSSKRNLKSKMFPYFIKHRLRNLMADLSQF